MWLTLAENSQLLNSVIANFTVRGIWLESYMPFNFCVEEHMHIRNRVNDIKKLRCNACQDYLKLIAVEEWKNQLYEKTKISVKYLPAKYEHAYKDMRQKGIENYEIDDMDVTFISEIIHKCPDIFPSKVETRKAIEMLTVDRNVNGHSSENEECEELYIYAFQSLSNLQRFIDTVDKWETEIPDEKRLEYFKIYSAKIVEMKKLIDEERINQVQNIKEMDRDIRKILSSDDSLATWCDVIKLYMDRSFKVDRDGKKYQEFVLRASDSGVIYAHGQAADYYLNIEGNCDEAERRMRLLMEYEKFSMGDVQSIISAISTYMIRGNKLTERLEELVVSLIDRGYPIEKDSSNVYVMRRKRKNP